MIAILRRRTLEVASTVDASRTTVIKAIASNGPEVRTGTGTDARSPRASRGCLGCSRRRPDMTATVLAERVG